MNGVNAGNANTAATLTAAGVWTDASGESSKDYEGSSVRVYGGRNGYVITDKIKQLNVGRYHSAYLEEGAPILERHISPTAEQMWDTFGVGSDPRLPGALPGLAAKDLAGVALIGVQELTARIEALELEIQRLLVLGP